MNARRLYLRPVRSAGGTTYMMESVDIAETQPNECDPDFVYVQRNKNAPTFPVLKALLFKVEQTNALLDFMDRLDSFNRTTRIEKANLDAELKRLNDA